MNELDYVKNMYENKLLADTPAKTIMYLAKYFIQVEKLPGKDTVKAIDTYMRQVLPDYYDTDWYKTVLSSIKAANKYSLANVEYIIVYKDELEKLLEIENIDLRKLGFCILCGAKYRNKKFNIDSDWCNFNFREIFRLANVTYRKSEYLMQLKMLIDSGLFGVSWSEKNYIRPTFMQSSGDEVMKITSMKDLGKQYLVYYGEYFICDKCGGFARQNKNKTKKYCLTCRDEVKKERDREYKKTARTAKMSLG